ncbi:MAG: cob(I)yrinic acid a,c-diamide adenosyltransferase [Planctomycetales bacterium]|nr:cob(I)yrinic acid a,c-diamide adenosyltransferase [Planctomycetales bacterium]MCA9164724.1 cob(I)yrinic acid a,c-diamide adenosyltransferase [Planctomycetales bacterium]MCA9202673.1 cob(I)yrinic acid a,c-diamide adenosyltransferase [Planctomycetales bacterium]
MKIYTKTGDEGLTGLFAGGRVSKDASRIEAYGTVDELNSAIGLARAAGLPEVIDGVLDSVQHELFALGGELATPDAERHGMRLIGATHIEALERAIDRFEEQLPPLKQFILPGGSRAAAELHLARTVCRRAERRVVSLMHESELPIAAEIVVYLNRLSDLLFVLARAANQAAGITDVPWQRP